MANSELAPFRFERRDPLPHDVTLEILYCGVCNTDLGYLHDKWGVTVYPLVPGHEIVGRVSSVGDAVTRFKIGDMVAVGCFVDSCRTCSPCKTHMEHLCEQGATLTYNGVERNSARPTFGGYSNNYVIDESYVLRVPEELDPAAAAPLLCAGITCYSPLRQWDVGPGQKVGVVGIGGLGHIAVKLARAMGADVTAITHSPRKANDALALGASETLLSGDPDQMAAHAGQFDFILVTIPYLESVDDYLGLLNIQGTLCIVGAPNTPVSFTIIPLISRLRRIAGSSIGGIQETQEMLDFCAEHGVAADIELIAMDEINEAFNRLERGDVKYRFVIDMARENSLLSDEA